ncbi:hypothetical protein Tco_0183989 [Tanacetum coccineum]
MYTIEERSKLLAEFFERRKKLLAEERVVAVRNKPPTRTQLRSLMMTYLKHTDLEEININVVIRSNGQRRYFSTLMRVLSIFDREDLCTVYQLVMNRYQDETPEGFDRVLWGDLMIMFNPTNEDEFWNSQQDWNVISWKLHCPSGMLELELRLTAESEGEAIFDLLRFIQKHINEFGGQDRNIKNWLVQKQMAFGKDFSNPFTADSLLKTIWFSTHHASHTPCYSNEALAIPEQTATGKEISNPFMAGSLPKNT